VRGARWALLSNEREKLRGNRFRFYEEANATAGGAARRADGRKCVTAGAERNVSYGSLISRHCDYARRKFRNDARRRNDGLLISWLGRLARAICRAATPRASRSARVSLGAHLARRTSRSAHVSLGARLAQRTSRSAHVSLGARLAQRTARLRHARARCPSHEGRVCRGRADEQRGTVERSTYLEPHRCIAELILALLAAVLTIPGHGSNTWAIAP
jgi:hypothetical protein